MQGARGAAQRTVAAGSASAGDPANPRGGEQNLGDIYRSRTMLATERENGGGGDLTLCQIQTANNLAALRRGFPRFWVGRGKLRPFEPHPLPLVIGVRAAVH